MPPELPPSTLQNPGPSRAPGARGGDTKEQVKQQANTMWSDAKETARSKLSEQQHTAASGMRDLAEALRKAARELKGDQQQMVARAAESAAGGLEQISGTIGGKDLGTLLDDAQSFARRQPVTFLAAAVAAGFLAVRFLKASDRGAQGAPESRFGDDSRTNPPDMTL